MSEELKPGWRWENFEHLKSTVVTAPNGMEYELRPGDITHSRAQRLLDAMFAALTQRPAAQATSEPACNHVLYETTDADRPKEICDRNGEAVLAMCKLCSKAEAELETAQPDRQWQETAAALNHYANKGVWPGPSEAQGAHNKEGSATDWTLQTR